MTAETPQKQQSSRPDTELLLETLRALFERRPRPIAIRGLRRRAAHRSSFPIEELIVVPARGDRIRLLFKNTSPRALSRAARLAKPGFLDDPLREIEIYRALLADNRLGTAGYLGSRVDPARGIYWLFLEKIEGRALAQVGDFKIWKQAAAWLADLHAQFDRPSRLPRSLRRRLIACDKRYFARWMNRARTFVAAARRDSAARRRFEQLGNRYGRYVDELAALPRSLIHGEFYASNIMVRRAGRRRICPVDWEQAAVGPSLIDLAALASGDWNAAQRRELAAAYEAARRRAGRDADRVTDLERGLELCRLHVAVQWLGWSPKWMPPKEHRRDWLQVALDAAERLG
jgi:hypothetical protein